MSTIYSLFGPNEVLGQVCRRAHEIADLLHAGGYIWNHTKFNLCLIDSLCDEEPFDGKMLFGCVSTGTCVDDQWIILYILRQVSTEFPQVYIRVTDEDGEFLLAEAAYDIPDWLEPDNALYRVWIVGGSVLIVGRDDNDVATDQAESISLETALSCIHCRQNIIALPHITSSVFSRIEGKSVPDLIRENVHIRIAHIPRIYATLLHKCPQLIAYAGQQYFLPETGRKFKNTVQNLRNLADSSPEEYGTVKVAVRFSRRIYAQFVGEKSDLENYQKEKQGEEQEEERKLLGQKVACGLELLRDLSATSGNAGDDDTFEEFVDSLRIGGYFYEKRELAMNFAFKQSTEPRNKEIAGFDHLVRNGAAADDKEIATWNVEENTDEWIADLNRQNQEETMNIDESAILDKLQKFVDDVRSGIDGIDGVGDEDEDEDEKESGVEDIEGDEFGSYDKDLKMNPHKRKFNSEADPIIDEDDFFEFFLQEALKLPPEEIAKFRAAAKQESDEEEEREDEYDDNDKLGPELLQLLLQSVKEGGGQGPAATLLGQLGMPI